MCVCVCVYVCVCVRAFVCLVLLPQPLRHSVFSSLGVAHCPENSHAAPLCKQALRAYREQDFESCLQSVNDALEILPGDGPLTWSASFSALC